MTYREQAGELAEARRSMRLAEVPGHCLQQTLMDLDKACRAHGTFVRWRSSRRWRPSFPVPGGQQDGGGAAQRSPCPGEAAQAGLGAVPVVAPLDGALIRSATLTRDGAHWYVSFLVDDGQSTPDVHAAPGTAVGVDRGVVVAVATSDGRLVNRDFLTDGERRRGLRLQRRLSRAAKDSRNRAKTREALGVIRARERRRRQDFCARTARSWPPTTRWWWSKRSRPGR